MYIVYKDGVRVKETRAPAAYIVEQAFRGLSSSDARDRIRNELLLCRGYTDPDGHVWHVQDDPAEVEHGIS